MTWSLDQRPRRNRKSAGFRALSQENHLTVKDLVWPLFVEEAQNIQTPISSMPGCYRWSLDLLLEQVGEAHALGIEAIALFPSIEESLKDSMASESLNPEGLLLRSVRALKKEFPSLTVITDVAMDPYSSDGHDGVVEDGEVVNDPTLNILAEMAVLQARAGADFVAPSDMMDGRVGYIRRALDEEGFSQVGIISYAVKYASAFYGPFREALNSTPRFGDKKTYQMNPGNSREALRECLLDVEEGADVLMVKPALSYMDIVSLVSRNTHLPVAAYNVSGEYSMVKAAAEKGWVDEQAIVMESLLSLKRAGAHMIFTYFAKDVARWLS